MEVSLDEKTVAGCLDPAIGVQVAAALDRGQSFAAIIENAYQLARGTTWIHLKVEYLLDTGQPAITIPKVTPLPEPNWEWKTFYTKVAGVSFSNSDGSPRQAAIRRCSQGERISLVREPGNPHDEFAVKVMSEQGEQIGYLSSDVAGNRQGIGWCVGRGMDDGCRYIARVASIGQNDDGVYGISLQVTFWQGPLDAQPPDDPALPPIEGRRNAGKSTGTKRIASTAGQGGGCLSLALLAMLAILTVLYAW